MKFEVHAAVLASGLTHEEAKNLNYPGEQTSREFTLEKDGDPISDQEVELRASCQVNAFGSIVVVIMPPRGHKFTDNA